MDISNEGNIELNIYELFDPRPEDIPTGKPFVEKTNNLYSSELIGLESLFKKENKQEESKLQINLFTYKENTQLYKETAKEIFDDLLISSFKDKVELSEYKTINELIKDYDHKQERIKLPLIKEINPFSKFYKISLEDIAIPTAIATTIIPETTTFKIMSALFVLSLSYGKYKLLKEERKYIKDELKENNNLVNFVKKSYELIDKNYFNTFFPEETKQLIAETDFLRGDSLLCLNLDEMNKKLLEIYKEEYNNMLNNRVDGIKNDNQKTKPRK